MVQEVLAIVASQAQVSAVGVHGRPRDSPGPKARGSVAAQVVPALDVQVQPQEQLGSLLHQANDVSRWRGTEPAAVVQNGPDGVALLQLPEQDLLQFPWSASSTCFR